MKKLIAVVSLIGLSGCIWTRETREVIVHKDPQGKITGIDYLERMEQQDAKPWKDGFGKYLFNQ